jgi:hypothetical protein
MYASYQDLQLTITTVKEHRPKYKHLDFKEQQKELGKDVSSFFPVIAKCAQSLSQPAHSCYWIDRARHANIAQWKTSSANPKNQAA